MARGILIALALVGLSLGGLPRVQTYYYDHILAKMTQQAWEGVCEYTEYDCTGVDMPEIIMFVPDASEGGLYGYYDGSESIFIANFARGAELLDTLFHEMVHYLQKEVGGAEIPGWPEDICKLEDEAWGITEQFMNDLGYDVDYSSWYVAYMHCWPYYAE